MVGLTEPDVNPPGVLPGRETAHVLRKGISVMTVNQA